MAASKIDSTFRQVRTLYHIGRVGDRADGELLEWFETRRAEAEVAFEELLARHGAMVLDVCRRVLRDPYEVEDAFQATFLVLVRRAGSVRNRDALGGWLHRVALRVASRARTEAAHRRAVEQQAFAPRTSDPTIDHVERADVRTALDEELDQIPASYRAALVACYLEALTHEEAAHRLGWPVGTVRSRLARGRDRLRSRLVRRGLAPDLGPAALFARPALVPAGLQKKAIQSMLYYVACCSDAGQVSATVAALAERVIRAMSLRTLSIVAAVALTVGTSAAILPILTVQVPRQARATPAQAQRGEPQPPVSLTGVVRDFEGHPVDGATVVAGAFNMRPNHLISTTGPDGRFTFPTKGDAQTAEYVLAYKEGLARASKLRHNSISETAHGDLELVLLRPEPFVGIVADHDGHPLVGARVHVLYMRGREGEWDHNPILANAVQGSPVESLFVATSDDQGRFRFPAVPAPQRVVIGASADGMADLSTEVRGDHAAGFITGTAEEPARLTMEREARVLGRLVSKLPGVSVAGLNVGVQSTNHSTSLWRDSRADAEGRFEFRGLPEGRVNIFPVEQTSVGGWTYRAIDNLALDPGKTFEVSIELIEGVLAEGKVADAVTGDPIVGVSVGMYGPARPRSGAAILIAETDDKGRYRFRLPSGMTYFYICSEGPWTDAGQTVEIPTDAKTFTVPTIEVRKGKAEATKAMSLNPSSGSDSEGAKNNKLGPRLWFHRVLPSRNPPVKAQQQRTLAEA